MVFISVFPPLSTEPLQWMNPFRDHSQSAGQGPGGHKQVWDVAPCLPVTYTLVGTQLCHSDLVSFNYGPGLSRHYWKMRNRPTNQKQDSIPPRYTPTPSIDLFFYHHQSRAQSSFVPAPVFIALTTPPLLWDLMAHLGVSVFSTRGEAGYVA